MSNGTFPRRFTKVDDLTRADHSYLTETDACYFIGEYTARKGFSYRATNNLVLNFKNQWIVEGCRSGVTRELQSIKPQRHLEPH